MRVAPATAFTALLDADYGAAAAATGAARLAVDTRTVTSTLRARTLDAELEAAAVAAAFPRATRELAADFRHAEYPPPRRRARTACGQPRRRGGFRGLQASLEMMRTGLFGSGAVRGIYLPTDGRWFIDLSY